MNAKHTILFILLSFIFSLVGKSQDISFRNFTTDDGLSHNSVLSVYQDERGFIWMGTRDGANLYNGEEIKVYKHQKENPNSLVYNVVSQIVGDRKGNVFFMTNKGISQYNINEATFTTLVKQQAAVGYFYKELYFACGNRIYQYEKDDIKVIYQLPDGVEIRSLCLHGDSIFAGTSHDGLFLLEGKQTLSHLIPSDYIYDIFRDSSGWYWATSYNGLGLYALKNGEVINYRSSSDPSTISSNQVYRCCEDRDGNIWIGTFRGLNKYNKKDRKFTRYYKEKSSIGFSEPSVWGLCCDNQGTIWAGTYYSGIKFFNPSWQIYQEYNVSHVESEGLSAPTIGKMVEDGRQNLWICTEGGGICKYNLHSRKFQWYKQDELQNSISHNNAKSIYYDQKRDVLWIGTHMGGFNKLDLKNNRFTHYKKKDGDKSSIASDVVMDIVPYGNNLLLATHNGVIVFNPESEKFHPLFLNKEYFQRTQYTQGLLIDNHSNLWIVNAHNGISCYSFESEVLTTYRQTSDNANEISSDNINGIYLDSRQRLWIYTNEHGLDVYHYDTGKFENFDMKKNGLGSDVVYAVCELSPDKFIVTTDEGFSILDYAKNTIVNYQKKDKIPLTAINEKSLLKTSTGEIFVGGVNGMISFYETNIVSVPRSYNIYPYRLLVDGHEVQVGDETGLLSQDLTITKKITIGSQYRVFSIEYTATDYMLYDKEKIIYKLEGFSDTWNSTRNKNTITYTNLPAGKYTLIIKALRDTENPVPECRLEIEILPPFYKTIWAYIIYVVLVVGITYFLIRGYNNRFKLQEALKYEKKHTEDIEILNRDKLRFFTDISHEFRTPLTIIIGQIEMLLQSQVVGTNIYNSISKVHKSCMQLKGLISELLDFRKQEQGHMVLKAGQHNIVSFLHEHYLTFQEYATQMQITYKFVKTHNDIQLWYDTKLMQKVMNNLVFNAFKHTPPKGKITISVRKREDEVIIEVTDNGEGIGPDEIDKIFNRFYQAEYKSSHPLGSGIGLALTKGLVELHHGTIDVYSEQNVETTFCVRLKMGTDHLNPEEIRENDIAEESQGGVGEKWSYDLNSQLQSQSKELEECNTSKPSIKKSKILIVENNEELRDMLVQLFKAFYQVSVACDGSEGLEMVKQEQPDIVVSDIMMPNLSGIELCKKIKEDIEFCHIPVVLLTAKTAVESNIEGLKTGADDYITKPFDVRLLLSRCNNLVNNRILLQERFSNFPQTTHKNLANNVMDKAFIDEAIRVIQEHMSDADFNIDIFARKMNIARTKLFTKLKAISGQTPAEFILTIRLKEAAILLRNEPRLNISEVSDRVGFSSPQYFRKCFKDKYRITPFDYRRDDDSKDETIVAH